MLARLKAEQDVDYVIVYHFSRIFRSSIDAAIVKRDLRKLDIRVVSTLLDLGDSLESQMVETIIHAVDEYRVQADAADIKYKMGQKAINGGTLGRAGLGYLNVREMIDGREVRTVHVDEQRGPIIEEAFNLFATGKYTIDTLHTRVTDLGLTARPTKSKPEGPISKSLLGTILRDRYYLGEVEYEGQWHPGRHQPLVSREIFERVQRVLDSHAGAGVRQRTHVHYLKGLLWCHRCGNRIIIQRAKGNGGVYFYFFCRGRQLHVCDLPYLLVEEVEQAVLRHYARVRFSDNFRTHARATFDGSLASELAASDQIRRYLTKQLAELDTQETNYLRLVGNPAWPQAKLEAEMLKIRAEREDAAGRLTEVEESLDIGRDVFHRALGYLRDPQALYQVLSPAGRKLMNTLVFARLSVDTDDQHVMVTNDELNEPFAGMVTADRRGASHNAEAGTENPGPSLRAYARSLGLTEGGRGVEAQNDSRGTVLADDAPVRITDVTLADLLELGLSWDRGSSRAAMVGPAGFEPATKRL